MNYFVPNANAEEALEKGVPADADTYLAVEAALRRSNLRLEAVRRFRKVKRPSYPEEI